MKHFLLLIGILFILSCSKKGNDKISTGFNIKDDLNKSFSFSEQPKRIISLAPNITEMLFDLDLGNNIVGNTTYCNYPDEAKKIEKVGDLLSVDFEKILNLQADIIFITTEGNTKIAYDKLVSLKQKVFVLNPKSFMDIKKNYLKIAEIFDKTDKAKEDISSWEKVEDSIRRELKNQPLKKAMFLVSLHPVILAGEKTFINEFLELMNLQNIASGIAINYPIFSREEILARDPEVILHTTHAGNDDDIYNSYPEWKKLKAVKKGQVYYLNPDIFFRPGPRYIEGIKALYRNLRR